MLNPYIPKLARIIKIAGQTPDVKLFTLEFADRKDRAEFSFTHGQFVMAGLLNFGEAAFEICSSAIKTKTFDLAVGRIGDLTEKLHQLKTKAVMTIRGPFGNGLAEKFYQNKELLLVGGGRGLIVMRSFILDYLAGALPAKKVNVFYGCLDEKNLLFKNEYKIWRKKFGLDICLNKPEKSWLGQRGVITVLFNDKQDFTDTVALIVGPPVMYKFVIEELQKRGLKDEDIFVSLERRMYCGIGVCQHCAIGPYYVCKDGPVFSWAQIKGIPGAI
ncbi:MAG: hypothetical protein A3B15_02210 [Candidatus Buchananbacteria bacterium RIFCSPLOWO2_01_FULL_45_31]|uniref:FAD-binding FR-type domain-containing protein n=1 Tax=Candidatus Buchananbacteria bacterium RIFCSPLOWO2_01_FULL_45_31 TaxID=1797545 RepID=A0A1G1YKW9_9BACT|nr:MAG: hypothetical protein A3B15_02210 [Candidatus Buchananbacteria bacterium RIFCSPLOWO2_01_FULL_45_31]